MAEAKGKTGIGSKIIKYGFRIYASCIFLLYFSALVAYYFPSSYTGPLSIASLFYWPILVLFSISMVVFLFLREWKWLIAHGILFLMSLGSFSSFFSFGLGASASLKNEITIYTHNVHLMGYYDGKLSYQNKERIMREIDQRKPDVICLQECFWNEEENSFFHWSQEPRLKAYSACERVTHKLSDNSHFGVVILSKYPIKYKGTIPFDNDVNNFAVYADLDTPNGILRVYSVHLQSFRLKEKELKMFDENLDVDEIQINSKPLLVQLYRSNLKREKQVDRLTKSIAESPYPVVVCGDFNDCPNSNTYYRMTKDLNDAYVLSNFGIGATYNGLLLGMRIDYCLTDKRLQVKSCERIEVNSSDHDALFATVGVQ